MAVLNSSKVSLPVPEGSPEEGSMRDLVLVLMTEIESTSRRRRPFGDSPNRWPATPLAPRGKCSRMKDLRLALGCSRQLEAAAWVGSVFLVGEETEGETQRGSAVVFLWSHSRLRRNHSRFGSVLARTSVSLGAERRPASTRSRQVSQDSNLEFRIQKFGRPYMMHLA